MRMTYAATRWELALATKSRDRFTTCLAEGQTYKEDLAKLASEVYENTVAKTNAAYDHILRNKAAMRRRRAILLKKRTCSMCGKTAPNSKPAFEYCGGCRHATIPRADRPRYCSEACQRAHWLAGHMHECPRQE